MEREIHSPREVTELLLVLKTGQRLTPDIPVPRLLDQLSQRRVGAQAGRSGGNDLAAVVVDGEIEEHRLIGDPSEGFSACQGVLALQRRLEEIEEAVD